ncbi:MAG: hypothetical protein QXM75_04515 [Candidatus Diapherotrites archaeon]
MKGKLIGFYRRRKSLTSKKKSPPEIAAEIERKLTGNLVVDIVRLPRMSKKDKIFLYRNLRVLLKKSSSICDSDRKHIKSLVYSQLPWTVAYGVNPKLFIARVKMIRNLLTPESNFAIHYVNEHVFPDGHKAIDVYAVFVRKIGKVAVLKIRFNPILDRNYIEFLQGVKGVDMRKVNEILGRPWFEVILYKVLQSAKPLFEAGHELYFEKEPGVTLFSKIRDRYLEDTPVNEILGLYRFSRRKRRVKEILGE